MKKKLPMAAYILIAMVLGILVGWMIFASYPDKKTAAQIAGYIARGELARDLQAFFPNHPRADIDEAAARGPKLFAKLRDHRQAAEGLHELASATFIGTTLPYFAMFRS